MTEPLLSVQLIVRNEETLLPFCLDSVKAIADEIVIVDSGIDRPHHRNRNFLRCQGYHCCLAG